MKDSEFKRRLLEKRAELLVGIDRGQEAARDSQVARSKTQSTGSSRRKTRRPDSRKPRKRRNCYGKVEEALERILSGRFGPWFGLRQAD
jgi:RNA polymerase-binding transcription factor DksA